MKAITTKGPGDLGDEPFDAEAADLDRFIADLNADNGKWSREIIEDFICHGSGPMFEAIGRIDWVYMLNGDHGVWLTDAQAVNVCGGRIPEHLKARRVNGSALKSWATAARPQAYEYRYDIMDVIAYQKSAEIAAQFGVKRDVTAEKKLAEYIIRDACNEWLADDDNIKKLYEVIYG